MSVLIPWSRIASLAIRPVLFSGNQEGSLGGPSLPTPRLGDRFAADIETTQLRQDAEGRILIAALTEACTADARISIHQPNLTGPAVYSPLVVDGGGQSGCTLNVKSGQPGTSLVRGQYIAVVHAGLSYLHMLTAGVIIGSGGTAALPLWPMLRFLTVDAEPVTLSPMIEGQLVGFERGAKWVRNRVDPLDFSIVERA